jgi:GTP cyclohydrolase IA
VTHQRHHPSDTRKVGGLAGDDVGYDSEEWAAVRPRHITPEQWQRFEGYMREILTALGMPDGSPDTADTPRRYLRAIFEATSGYEGDEKLVTAFPTECRGGPDCRISQVVEGPIPFFSLCEHHSLPARSSSPPRQAGKTCEAASQQPAPPWRPGTAPACVSTP